MPVTPGYGAPEQVLGQRVTPCADVFSLGAVLAYAVSGRRAYEGTHIAAVQYAVVHGEPQLAGIAPEMHTLIAPCLAKDPATRPVPAQIVQAMAAPKSAERVWRRGPLAEAIKERETAAHRLTAHVTLETAPSVTRRRLLTGLGAGGVVVAGGGGTAAWWLGSRGSQGGSSGQAKSDPFDIPAAVPTPMASLDSKGGENLLTGAKQPTIIWSKSDVVDVYSRPLLPVRDVIVFGAASGGIAAYDVRDGSTRWSASDIRTKSGYLSLSDRLVIGADKRGVLRTFVPSTGTPKWTCPAAEAAMLLAADKDAVYFVTLDDKLRSVRRADAKVRWTATVPADFRKKLLNPAAIGQGKLVMSTSDGNVLVVRTSDGRKEWARLDHAEVTVRPAVHGDTVYINAKNLDARRLSDGKLIWSANIYDPEEWGPPEAHANVVYANGGDVTRCLDARDGSELWHAYNDADDASPALLQGNAVWTLHANSNSRSPSVLVSAIRSFDGEEKWTYKLPAASYLRMAADGNRVFVMKDSNVVTFSTF
ncbi:PQQ-binding-like beta-propeller repeat protein [Streptomyces sp. NPDC050997]|uniref:outer membrane protein assembly factor BamB family protein n=1 Tax=Streptomyces sp. NPDC050997 TaxID=3155519 RepID=UPI00343D8F4C